MGNEEPGAETVPVSASQILKATDSWQRSLAGAVRDAEVLISELRLPAEFLEPARRAAELFPLLVPRSFLARMEPANPRDPLLLQVLPLGAEFEEVPGYRADALEEADAHLAPGLLQKYAGRALLIAAGACAVHCRYCFRRHYPYGEEPRRLEDWEPAFQVIEGDSSLREILLSGGDPLMLTDERLAKLWSRLDQIPHLRRIRLHTRLPIVLPDRVTETFLNQLRTSRLTPIVVVHANHPREVAADCAESLKTLVRAGVTVLNQSVLLKNINDSADALTELSERLIGLGVMPYYLHQTDRVRGTAHFAVPDETARALIAELRRRLPGYAVPRLVREIPGEPHKMPL